MAQFRAIIQGQRGQASRLGSKNSGLSAHVNGWNSGVTVQADYNAFQERDEFAVFATGGTNGATNSQYIGRVILENGKPTFQASQDPLIAELRALGTRSAIETADALAARS